MTKLKKGPELYAAIRRLHAEGKTAGEVAQALGIHRNSVYRHGDLLGLPRFTRVLRKTTYAPQIRLLQWEGKTAAEAAKAIGISVARLNHYRRLLDVPEFARPDRVHTPPNGWTEAEDTALERCIADGLSLAETALRLRRSYAAVAARRAALDLPFFKRRPAGRSKSTVWLPQRIERLAELRAKRFSLRLIAEKFGMTRNAVAGAVRDHLKETA